MNAEAIEILLDGRTMRVAPGTSLAAAIMNAGGAALHRSVSGEPRGALCGMGICFECRVKVNGMPHQRACMIICAPAMRVETGNTP